MSSKEGGKLDQKGGLDQKSWGGVLRPCVFIKSNESENLLLLKTLTACKGQSRMREAYTRFTRAT